MDYLKALKRIHKKGKLSHAYLLSGNDKKGKEYVIDEFVRFLLGVNYRKIHADVTFVSPEKDEITIGQIRKLKEYFNHSAWNSPYKIGIIKSADRMNQEAQSAFLKLLEEPKGDTLLFLEVSHASLLLDTIRSRMQELRMYVFSKDAIDKQGLLTKLKKASIYERFEFAKKAAEDQKALYETLVSLQHEARLEFLEKLKKEGVVSLIFLRTVEKVLRSISHTQVNLRLATERILLEL